MTTTMAFSRPFQQMQRRFPRRIIVLAALFLWNASVTFALTQAVPKRPTTSAVVSASSRNAFALHHRRFRGLKETLLTKKTSPLFQSSECADSESFKYSSRRRFLDTAHENLANLGRIAVNNGSAISLMTAGSTQALLETLKQCWWCLPMTLALVPPFWALFYRTHPSMPSFWPLVQLDSVLHSQYGAIILGTFLLSNIAYFVSGIYLYLQYHLLIPEEEAEVSTGRDPLLGGAVLTAGTVSTIFHTVQALGPTSIAESLCFIDHGVAISSVLYFFQKLGWPSRRTWLLSIAGLVTLAIHHVGYAWLHSIWHLLSASAAVVWARDGLGNKRDRLVG